MPSLVISNQYIQYPLKANRLHLCDYPQTHIDYRHTMSPNIVRSARQSQALTNRQTDRRMLPKALSPASLSYTVDNEWGMHHLRSKSFKIFLGELPQTPPPPPPTEGPLCPHSSYHNCVLWLGCALHTTWCYNSND